MFFIKELFVCLFVVVVAIVVVCFVCLFVCLFVCFLHVENTPSVHRLMREPLQSELILAWESVWCVMPSCCSSRTVGPLTFRAEWLHMEKQCSVARSQGPKKRNYHSVLGTEIFPVMSDPTHLDVINAVHQYHRHHHLSFNREGGWSTTDDFTTSFLHFSLFSIALWDLANPC